jgi:hypothetical protein
MFEKLKAYKEMYGDCLVQQYFVCDDGKQLGRWVATPRKMPVNDAALLAQRQQDLDAIGFVWVVNERTRQLTPVTGVHVSKKSASLRDGTPCTRN